MTLAPILQTLAVAQDVEQRLFAMAFCTLGRYPALAHPDAQIRFALLMQRHEVDRIAAILTTVAAANDGEIEEGPRSA